MLLDGDEQVGSPADRDVSGHAETDERVGERGFSVIREGGQCELRQTEDVVRLVSLIGHGQTGTMTFRDIAVELRSHRRGMCRNALRQRRIHVR